MSKRAVQKRARRNAISRAKRKVLRALGVRFVTKTKCKKLLDAGATGLEALVLRRMARGTMARASVYPFRVTP